MGGVGLALRSHNLKVAASSHTPQPISSLSVTSSLLFPVSIALPSAPGRVAGRQRGAQIALCRDTDCGYIARQLLLESGILVLASGL
jgi:hypothetical protein